MSTDEAKKNAVQFLKAQAEIMKKYGQSPKLRGPDYQAALVDTARTFAALSGANTKRNERASD